MSGLKLTFKTSQIEWPLCMITSDEEISPPSLFCQENSLHLHSLLWIFFSNLLRQEFFYAKLSNFTISKGGLVVKFAHLTYLFNTGGGLFLGGRAYR